MKNKVLFEVKIDECFKKITMKSFFSYDKFNVTLGFEPRLYVLNIYQYLFVQNPTPPNPLHI